MICGLMEFWTAWLRAITVREDDRESFCRDLNESARRAQEQIARMIGDK